MHVALAHGVRPLPQSICHVNMKGTVAKALFNGDGTK